MASHSQQHTNPVPRAAHPVPIPIPASTPHPQPHPHPPAQPLPMTPSQSQSQNNTIPMPASPRRMAGAGAGRFTPSGAIDQAHESEWASRLAALDWDETSIVFTKRQLVDFLRYVGVHVDANCENIAGLPRYAVFGKISSAPPPVLPGQAQGSAGTSGSPAASLPSSPSTELPPPIPITLTGGFRPTHRSRNSRSSLSGSPQTTGLFGPGDDAVFGTMDLPASPPAAVPVVYREVVRPSPPPPSYPPPDTAQPESSDEERPVQSASPTPPTTPGRTPGLQSQRERERERERTRQPSGGLSSAPGGMFPIENVQHTSTGYPIGPSMSSAARERDAHASGSGRSRPGQQYRER